MKKIDYDEVINRIGYFRNRVNLSARETSMRMGYNDKYISRIENKVNELKVKTLLDFCEVVGINISEFFYSGKEYSKEDMELFELINSIPKESKQTVIDLIKKIK